VEVLFVDIPEIEIEISHGGLSSPTHGRNILDDFATDK